MFFKKKAPTFKKQSCMTRSPEQKSKSFKKSKNSRPTQKRLFVSTSASTPRSARTTTIESTTMISSGKGSLSTKSGSKIFSSSETKLRPSPSGSIKLVDSFKIGKKLSNQSAEARRKAPRVQKISVRLVPIVSEHIRMSKL